MLQNQSQITKQLFIINFFSDLIESLADRSSDSKSSSSATHRPQTNNTYNEQYSNNTQSIESETWISPVPSDDYQIPQNAAININTSNFINNNNLHSGNPRMSSSDDNVYVIDPTPSRPSPHPSTTTTTNYLQSQQASSSSTSSSIPQPPSFNPNYPSTMAFPQPQIIPQMQYSPLINNNAPANQRQPQQIFISPQQSFHNNLLITGGGGGGAGKRPIVTVPHIIPTTPGPTPPKRKASDLLIAQKPLIKDEPIYEEDENMYGSNNMISSISRMESNENLQQRQIQVCYILVIQIWDPPVKHQTY